MRFYGYILMALQNRGCQGKAQMFLVSYATKYHGLSRFGTAILSKLGFGLPLSSLDDAVRKDLRRSEEQIGYMSSELIASVLIIFIIREIKDGHCSIWIDNFAKIIAHRTPMLTRGSWAQCLWTGMAYQKFEPSPSARRAISTRLRYDNEGNLVPAMPVNVLLQQKIMLIEFDNVCGEPLAMSDTALVTQYAVTSNPLKPFVGTSNPALQERLNESLDGLKNFFPAKLLPFNIGSNRGLLHVLRLIHEENDLLTAEGPGRYLVINCDSNIFNRILKVHLKSRDTPPCH